MNWWENLMIIAGISLDLFAAMECQGSLVAKVDKKNLIQICSFMAVWQVAAFFVGHLLAELLYRNEMAYDERFVGSVIAVVIFLAAGIRLLIKAIKNERIQEHLEQHLDIRQFLHLAAANGSYMLLAGMAFGFLEADIRRMLVLIAAMTVVVIIAGMYTGYYFGFRHKMKAYIGGAVLLWIVGGNIIAGHIIS